MGSNPFRPAGPVPGQQANPSDRRSTRSQATAKSGAEPADRPLTTARPSGGVNLEDAKDFEQDGYSFFFYSNDHPPIHVHVRRGGGEAVFVVEPSVELRESVALNVNELSRAENLIHDNIALIKRKWADHLG